MEDRHPPGTAYPPAPAPNADYAPYGSYDPQSAQYGDYAGYDGNGTNAYGHTDYSGYQAYDAASAGYQGATATATATGSFEADPLFGDMPGEAAPGAAWGTDGAGTAYDPYAAPGPDASYGGQDLTGAWGIPGQTGHGDSGQWDSTAWNASATYADGQLPYGDYGDQSYDGYGAPAQHPYAAGPEAGAYETQVFETSAYEAQAATQVFDGQTFTTSTFGTVDPQAPYGAAATQTWAAAPATAEEFAAAATQTFQHAFAQPTAADPDGARSHGGAGDAEYGDGLRDTGELPPLDGTDATAGHDGYDPADPDAYDPADLDAYESPDAYDAHDPADEGERLSPVGAPAGGRAAARQAPRSRARRKGPAKRSALLTVAVPSACVMGVAGIAAASVDGLGGDAKETTATAPDPGSVRPAAANNKLDTQLEHLSADAGDFADRASRTQERMDLAAKKEAEKKKEQEEEARKERLRPKFVLPVKQHGLSAYFGQAGVNWMSVHTGIDFPVQYGTAVFSAIDGTVRTQYNSAYGNMAIVTAKDGTETWYCHLSGYSVPSGTVVQAGDQIALSGSSGNSTGPHMHFEVRPGGGAAVDPLPWLRSHGLDPT
ncbi:M23 family metallopeptidase [Streptomyces sp. NPDC050560]|uniref:M23 family metallopeptidase n=1 Tax=Streptomyces sp. NPDC050560 TaxID=3365630 RepID=UPI00378DA81C